MNKIILLSLILTLHVGACRIEANSTVLPPHTLTYTLLPVAMHNLTPPINITSTLQRHISWSLPHFSPATWWTGMATLCAVPVVLFFMKAKLFNTYYRLKLFLTLVNAKETDLYWAALNGYKDIVEILIEKNVDIDAKDEDNWTALHHAANQGHKDVAELLIEKGADIDVKTKGGWSALHFAALNGHQNVVKLLIEEGAQVDAQDTDNYRTALHFAALNGYKDIVEMLINNGADVNAKTKNGWTALYFAAQNDHKEIVELLINNEIKKNNIPSNLNHPPKSRQCLGPKIRRKK